MTRSDAGMEDRVANLFDRHYLPLCRLAALLLSDADSAEDVVQEAFLRTFSGWWRLRDPDRAERYLRRSVVNLCRSRYRHRDAEHRGNALSALRDQREAGPRTWDSDHQDMVVVVLEAVSGLPPRQRMTTVLRYYLDLPEAEVAELMGCSVGTVKSQVAKAKAALAGVLGERDAPGAAPTEIRRPERLGPLPDLPPETLHAPGGWTS
ncbi:MAG: SigE family RNA polymerase sigma factor [Actinomycetota bacterium]|nr:SigE family RNA polymerase sigma factor [Actinomycetota bacterium]